MDWSIHPSRERKSGIIATRQVRGTAHNGCNLQLKKIRDIAVFFHNLSGYDGHMIFQNLTKVEGMNEPKVVD